MVWSSSLRTFSVASLHPPWLILSSTLGNAKCDSGLAYSVMKCFIREAVTNGPLQHETSGLLRLLALWPSRKCYCIHLGVAASLPYCLCEDVDWDSVTHDDNTLQHFLCELPMKPTLSHQAALDERDRAVRAFARQSRFHLLRTEITGPLVVPFFPRFVLYICILVAHADTSCSIRSLGFEVAHRSTDRQTNPTSRVCGLVFLYLSSQRERSGSQGQNRGIQGLGILWYSHYTLSSGAIDRASSQTHFICERFAHTTSSSEQHEDLFKIEQDS